MRSSGRQTLAAVLVAASAFSPVVAGADGPAPFLYVLARHQSALWQVDTRSGERRLLELFSYPEILSVDHAAVTPTGEVLLSAWNAINQIGIFAFNPASGSRAGVSGPVEDGGATRGSGPGFEPALAKLVAAPTGELYALRLFQGLMRVGVATGDRTTVSQSASPAVGRGFPLTRPVDLAVETSGSLLVMEEYEGLVRVALANGDRAIAYPSTMFIEPPINFDILPDGRIVHGLSGTNALFAFDPRTRRDEVLTGRGRGAGPELGALGDVVVTPDGSVFVIDLIVPTVLAVDPLTGDRTVISGGAGDRGGGEPFPTAIDRPTFATHQPGVVPASPPPRPPRRRVPSP